MLLVQVFSVLNRPVVLHVSVGIGTCVSGKFGALVLHKRPIVVVVAELVLFDILFLGGSGWHQLDFTLADQVIVRVRVVFGIDALQVVSFESLLLS